MTEPPAAPTRGRGHRLRGALRLVIGLAVAVGVLWVVSGKRSELEGALSYLSHLRWQWLVLAVVAEFLALVSFGALQRQLLEAGGAPMGLGVLTAIAFAGNAIQNSLPAGPLVSRRTLPRSSPPRPPERTLASTRPSATVALSTWS